MAISTCWACRSKFEAARSSKLCCSVECRKLYQAEYDHERYVEFRDGNRRQRQAMLAVKYSVASSNLYKMEAVCDECLTKFYHSYDIFQKFNDVYVSSYNTTQWGASVCPNCGLVERSQCDEIFLPVRNMDQFERKLYLDQIPKSRKPMVRREAIYVRNMIDFIAEAEDVRKKLNQIFDRGELSQEDRDECIAVLFRKIKESK